VPDCPFGVRRLVAAFRWLQTNKCFRLFYCVMGTEKSLSDIVTTLGPPRATASGVLASKAWAVPKAMSSLRKGRPPMRRMYESFIKGRM